MVVESPGSVLFRTEAVPVGARKKSDFAVPRRWGQSPASFPDHFPRPSQRPVEGRRAVRRSEVPRRSSLSRVGPPWGLCRTIPSFPFRRGAFTRKIFEDPSSVVSPPPCGYLVVKPPLSRRRRRGKGPRSGGSLPQRAKRSGVERSPFFFLPSFFPFPSFRGREILPRIA